MRRASALLSAVVAAALIGGCAGQPTTTDNAADFTGDQKAIAQVVDDLAKAGKDKDAKEICSSIFTAEVSQRLKQGANDCEDAVSEQLKDASSFTLDVKKIDVQGDKATAQVQSQFDGDDTLRTLSFERVREAWRVAGMSS